MDANTIKNAVLKLDAGDADHWTAAGLPSVSAVAEMLGEPVTRAEIAEAIPGYDRDKANAPEQDAPSADAEGSKEPEADQDEGENGEPDGSADLTPLGFSVEDEGEASTVRDGETGELVEDAEAPSEPDAIALIEAALSAAQGEAYRHNHELQAFVRQWMVQQNGIKEWQKRLDARRAAKLSR